MTERIIDLIQGVTILILAYANWISHTRLLAIEKRLSSE